MDNKYQVVALMGKAGAGKDAMQQTTCKLHSDMFHKIVSCTTRPPRSGEVDGEAYHFVSITDFTRKVLNGDMLEATEFRDWFYGTPISSLVEDKINIGVFNPAGVEALLQDSRIETTVIFIDARDRTRLMRYLTREKTPDCAEMCRRYFADEKDFADLDFDYYTINNEENGPLDLLHPYHSMDFEIDAIWTKLHPGDSHTKAGSEMIKEESSDDEVKND